MRGVKRGEGRTEGRDGLGVREREGGSGGIEKGRGGRGEVVGMREKGREGGSEWRK